MSFDFQTKCFLPTQAHLSLCVHTQGACVDLNFTYVWCGLVFQVVKGGREGQGVVQCGT